MNRQKVLLQEYCTQRPFSAKKNDKGKSWNVIIDIMVNLVDTTHAPLGIDAVKRQLEKLIKKYQHTFSAAANSSQTGANHRPDGLEFRTFEAYRMVCRALNVLSGVRRKINKTFFDFLIFISICCSYCAMCK